MPFQTGIAVFQLANVEALSRSMDRPRHKAGHAEPPPVAYRPDGAGARDSWVRPVVPTTVAPTPKSQGEAQRYWLQRLQQPECRGKFAAADRPNTERRNPSRRHWLPLVPGAANTPSSVPRPPPRQPTMVSPRTARAVRDRNAAIADALAQELGSQRLPTPRVLPGARVVL